MPVQPHVIEDHGQPEIDSRAKIEPAESVSVVVLAPNDTGLLAELLRAMPPWVHDLTIIHDGRYDTGAFEVARMLLPTAEIIDQPEPDPLAALPAALSQGHGEVVVVIEDLESVDPSEIPAFVGAVIAGADVAMPSRFLPGGSTAAARRRDRLAWRRLMRKVNRQFGTNRTDLGGSLFAARRSALQTVLSTGLPQTEGGLGLAFDLSAMRDGVRLTEVASVERRRSSLRSTVAANRAIGAVAWMVAAMQTRV